LLCCKDYLGSLYAFKLYTIYDFFAEAKYFGVSTEHEATQQAKIESEYFPVFTHR